MALALRPQHAAVGVVGAAALRHFLRQAGWGAGGGLEAAVSAARSAAEAATLAAAAAASAGATREEQCPLPPAWLGLSEPPPCPEPPACECRCESLAVQSEADEEVLPQPAWQVLGSLLGHVVVVTLGKLCARRQRDGEQPRQGAAAVGERRGAAGREPAAVEWTGSSPAGQRARRRGGGVLE